MKLQHKHLETSSKIVDAKINEKIQKFIEDQFKEDLNYFKKKNKIKINFEIDQNLSLQEYTIEFKSKTGKVIEKVEKFEILQKHVEEKIEKISKSIKSKKSNFKRKKIKKNFLKKKNQISPFLVVEGAPCKFGFILPERYDFLPDIIAYFIDSAI